MTEILRNTDTFEILMILLTTMILAEVDKHLWTRVCWRFMSLSMGIVIIAKFIIK